MNVKRYDYASQFPQAESLFADLQAMILNGDYVLADQVQSFESQFAAYLGCSFAVGVNSGTDALILALLAAGIGPGDEVITQANTFHATVLAIHRVGATPVLVDACPRTYLMDVQQVPHVLSPRTRAILPVHLYGKPTAMQPILDLAQKHQLIVIEDAAQSHGAIWQGQKTGSFGHLACFSFHPSKNLAAAGDGGCVVGQDPVLEERLNVLRNLGMERQNHHVVCGLNSKLDALQARILQHKLSYLDGWNADRRRIAAQYRAGLTNLPLRFQSEDEGETHAYHLFQIETAHRNKLLEYLVDRGIEVTVRYPTPIHQQPAFAHLAFPGSFPVAERLSRELLCLPIRPGMPDAEIQYVIQCVQAFFGEGLA